MASCLLPDSQSLCTLLSAHMLVPPTQRLPATCGQHSGRCWKRLPVPGSGLAPQGHSQPPGPHGTGQRTLDQHTGPTPSKGSTCPLETQGPRQAPEAAPLPARAKSSSLAVPSGTSEVTHVTSKSTAGHRLVLTTWCALVASPPPSYMPALPPPAPCTPAPSSLSPCSTAPLLPKARAKEEKKKL